MYTCRIWLHYLSFITYGIKGLAINEYFSLKFSCKPSDLLPSESDPLYAVNPPLGYGFTSPNQVGVS